jgi:hypothetical protein
MVGACVAHLGSSDESVCAVAVDDVGDGNGPSLYAKNKKKNNEQSNNNATERINERIVAEKRNENCYVGDA